MYWGYVVEGTELHIKIISTIGMFVVMMILLGDADRQFIRGRKREQRKAAQNS